MSPTEVWVRQQIIILCDYVSDQAFADLEHRELNVEFAKTYRIPLLRNKTNSTKTLHRFGWVLLPIDSGEYDIPLPPVTLDFGKRKIALPTYLVGVNLLPIYLKPDVPVGAIAVTLEHQLPTVLVNNHMTHLKINVRATGIPADWLTHLEAKFSENSSVRFYVHRKRVQQHIEQTGIRTDIQFDIGILPTVSGRQTLLTGVIEYFNPLAGRYFKHKAATDKHWVLPLWLIYAGYAVALTTLIVAAVRIAPKCKKLAYTARQLRIIRQNCTTALPIENAIQAMRQVFNAYGIQSTLPDLACYRQWSARYGESPNLINTLRILIVSRFSAKKQATGQAPIELQNTLLELTKIRVWLLTVTLARCFRPKQKSTTTKPARY